MSSGKSVNCPTCNHSNKKEPEEVHGAGQCERCNCGQSEMVHRGAMAGGYYSEDGILPRRSDAGNYRIYEAPRAA